MSSLFDRTRLAVRAEPALLAVAVLAAIGGALVLLLSDSASGDSELRRVVRRVEVSPRAGVLAREVIYSSTGSVLGHREDSVELEVSGVTGVIVPPGLYRVGDMAWSGTEHSPKLRVWLMKLSPEDEDELVYLFRGVAVTYDVETFPK